MNWKSPRNEVVTVERAMPVDRPPGPELQFEDGSDPSFGSLLAVLRRRKLVILATAMLGTGLGAGVALQLPARYAATSLVKIETDEPTHISSLQATSSSLPPDINAVTTEVDVIRSPNIASRVVRKLGLSTDPELTARTFSMRELLSRASALLNHPRPPAPPLTREQQVDLAAGKLLDVVSVGNSGRSYVIRITADTRKAALSAAIANATAALYVDFRREQKADELRASNGLLSEHLAQLRTRMVEAEQAAQVFREKNGLTIGRLGQGGGEVTVSGQQLLETSTQLTLAAGERAQKVAEFEQFEALVRAGRAATAPRARSSPVVQRLTEQEAEISARAADLASKYGSGNLALQAVQAMHREIERKIDAEVGKIELGARSEVEAARERESTLRTALERLRSQVNVQGTAAIRLRELDAEASTDRSVYEDFLSRVKRTGSDVSMQVPNVSVVSDATVPLSPTGPPRADIVMLSGAASLVIGVLVALGLELRERGLRTLEEFERATSLPALGFLPSTRRHLRFDLTKQSPQFVEALNFIRQRLPQSRDRSSAHVILVTSAVPGEGKTAFALALATSAVRSGARVLLLDCDLRCSRISVALGLPRKAGLTALLKDGAVDDMMAAGLLPGLDVIPAGRGCPDPANALGSSAMRLLILQARNRYDLVVLDAPPVQTVADALPLSLLADSTILVARWRRTPRRLVVGALTTLQRHGASVVGGVLTRTDLRKAAQLGANSQTYVFERYSKYLRT